MFSLYHAAMNRNDPRPYTPALSKFELTEDFDGVIAVTAREKRLRASLLQLIAPQDEEAIVDIGSGTGTVAIAIKAAAPASRVVAVDPDRDVHSIAEDKASSANTENEFVTARGDDEITEMFAGNAGKVVSTSVLHQCPDDMKLAILANAYRLLKPGGSCSSRTMASSGIC